MSSVGTKSPTSEVGVGYLAGASCLGISGDIVLLYWLDYIVRPFVNIVLTASIAANCESQIIVGTSLSAAVKKCMAWEYYNDSFDYTETPLGLIGCKIIIHNNSKIYIMGPKRTKII